MDEPILREQARAVIQEGKLPSRAPDRTWGGPGVGAPCSVCGKPVTKDEKEFEIEFARNGDNPGLDKSTFTSGASPPGSSSDDMPSDEPRLLSPMLTEWRGLIASSRAAIIDSRMLCASTRVRVEVCKTRMDGARNRIEDVSRTLSDARAWAARLSSRVPGSD